MSAPSDLREKVGRRLRGLVYIAEQLDPEDGDEFADRAWIIATVDEITQLFDAARLEEAKLREAAQAAVDAVLNAGGGLALDLAIVNLGAALADRAGAPPETP